MSQHTPTPWELPNGKEKNQFGTYRIGEKPYNDGSAAHIANIALVGSLNDAEFIVRAVNSHEALLEALKTAKNCLKENRGPNMDEFKQIQAAITKAQAVAEQ